MKITTKLPTPSGSKYISNGVILKIVLLLMIAYVTMTKTSSSSRQLSCDENISDNLNKTCATDWDDDVPASAIDGLQMLEYVKKVLTTFLIDTLPRFVSAGLVLHISICCGYVGLVHFKLLSPN